LKFRIFLQPPKKGGASKRDGSPSFFFPLFPFFILPQEELTLSLREGGIKGD
jgi:hypothetical protein